MSPLENLEKQKAELKASYDKQMTEIKHWEEMCKKFYKMQKKNTDAFVIEVPHIGNLDNEMKIESYAQYYGFTITHEELGLLTSKYTFKKKEN